MSKGATPIAAAVLLLVACGGNTTNGSSASSCSGGITRVNDGCTLAFMQGATLSATFTTQSGNCGDLPPEMGTVMGNPQMNLAAGCPGGCGTLHMELTDAGGCQLTANIKGCQVNGSSQTYDLSETATWNASYTMGQGTATLTEPGVCSGTYSISIVVQ